MERDTFTKYRSLNPHGMHGGGLSPSFAFGGSSTVWGVTVIPYRKYEIKKWPITGKQFEQQFADGKQTFNSNAHHIGTTRMSDNPKTGVVDSNGRVHGINNLNVGGSSIYPTSGHANPTLLAVMLALRLAKKLLNEYGR